MRAIRILTVFLLAMAFSATAYAERGLGGKFTKRNLTQAPGTLKVIAGPKAPQLLGTSGMFSGDAGFEMIHPEISVDGGTFEVDNIMNFNAGAVYGITNELEAGAMFLPLQLAPDGRDTYGDVPVFLTYGMNMGNFDIGGRLTTIIPVESEDLALNVGVPVLFRGNGFRIDTGLFLPVALGDDTIVNLNVPVRASFQATTNIFGGIETGLMMTNLVGPEGADSDAAIPLGLFGGYTLPAGGAMIDLIASFGFDQALFLTAEEPVSSTQFSWYRLNVGVNAQLKF